MAAEGGHEDTVKYLVAKKAKINVKDEFHVSIWDYTTEDRLGVFLGTQ